MKSIAVIPARGGSKRIPRKNIRLFGGKPMIAWSIEAAQASGCFDQIVVSTDDDEIAEVAMRYGADVPFRRPPDLSDDHATTVQVMHHAVQWLVDHGVSVPMVCCLYATAPFVQADDLRNAAGLLDDASLQYVFSATSFPYPIQRALRLTTDGRVEMFAPENFVVRSQDLEPAYHDAGQFYWGRSEAWLNEVRVFGPRSKPWLLPRHRVQDIDDAEDWLRAEWLFQFMMGIHNAS